MTTKSNNGGPHEMHSTLAPASAVGKDTAAMRSARTLRGPMRMFMSCMSFKVNLKSALPMISSLLRIFVKFCTVSLPQFASSKTALAQ